MTALANLALAAALYLGWHLSAFTTLQLWTAAVVIAALEIILVLPYRIWRSNEAEIDRLNTAADRKQKMRDVFNEIGDLRVEMSRLYNEMLRVESLNLHESVWNNRFEDLQKRIGAKIEQFCGKAEADLYMNRGTIHRTIGPNLPPHQLYIDIALFDLDVLRKFIDTHSPRVQ